MSRKKHRINPYFDDIDTLSREARLFVEANEGLEVAPNVGVVVFSNVELYHEIAMVVADFSRHTYLYVLRSCFKPRSKPLTRSQFYKDETPYLTLENVQYQCDHNNIVKEKVTRYIKKWEVRTYPTKNGDVFAVKCKCVISNKGECYTDVAGVVPCSAELINKNLTRNVSFICWLGFDPFDENLNIAKLGNQIPERLNYHLQELVQVDPENFEFVREAPWWPKTPAPEYFVDEFQELLNNKGKPDSEPIIGLIGYYLYENIIYVPLYPYFTIRLAWKMFSKLCDFEKNIKSCEPIAVDVKYNHSLECHIVYSASPMTLIPNMIGNVVLDDTNDNNEYIEMSIRPLTDCPGYFISLDESAIIHDRFGLAVEHYNTDNVLHNVGVRYNNPDDHSSTPLYLYYVPKPLYWEPNGLIGLEGDALCINTNEFYCPLFHQFYLKTKTGGIIKPGDFCRIILDSYDYQTNTFYVTWKILREYDRIPTKFVRYRHQFLMHLDIIREPTLILSHSIIGVIGFNYTMVQKIPPVRPFAIAMVEFRPKVRTNTEGYQSRGHIINTFAQADTLAGYE